MTTEHKPHQELFAIAHAANDQLGRMTPLELKHKIEDALAATQDIEAVHALDSLFEQLETLREAATALYERVEMDESVGVCLSSRFESLNLGAVLSNPARVPRDGCRTCHANWEECEC